MRCSSCNKFVSEENGDPEVEDIEIEAEGATPDAKEFTGNITATVRIVRLCAECSDELKEYRIEFNEQVEIEIAHAEHELEIKETACESTEKELAKKKYVGAKLSYEVLCTTCNVSLDTGDLDDSIATGDMDEVY